jgi:hypothetical protein
VLNLSLASQPVFTETTIEVELAGTVANWTCLLPYNALPNVTSPERGLTAQINGQIPNCLLLYLLTSVCLFFFFCKFVLHIRTCLRHFPSLSLLPLLRIKLFV